MTDTEKVEKIKELMKKVWVNEINKTPDEIFEILKEYTINEISSALSEFMIFYNDLRKVLEE